MEGLTAKVFRTYNASKTLQDQLDLLTDPKANVSEKFLSYNRANRQVALLCNHQRSIPKTFEKSMETLKAKVKGIMLLLFLNEFLLFRLMQRKRKLMNKKKN
jgi:DNA topoisomerase-1